MNKKENMEVLIEIYKDFMDKRNMYKIEIDNYKAELEVLEKSIEYSSRIEDTSKVFSPRASENIIDSIEDYKQKQEVTERLLEESREKYEYYNNFYEKLKPIIEEGKKPDINDLIYGDDPEEKDDGIFEKDENITYNLNLNYNMDDTKDKLSNISHKIETCLKIFDNDPDRVKQEIKSIGKMIDKLMKTL